ncbi:MAG: MarR family transcriptional regulator [Brucellaceae bacterium]|nr:MarR family transcriptional regulator [Brucellaceae bacterium]
MFEKRKSPGYLANFAARVFASHLRDQVAPLGLAPAQFMVLLELWDEDGLTQKQLFERLEVEQATMANTISRMERDGLVERRAHPEDGRARSIFLTARARALEAAAKSSATQVNQRLMADFTAEEYKMFLEFLQRIIQRGSPG